MRNSVKAWIGGLAALAVLGGCASYDPYLKPGKSSDRYSHDIEVVEDTAVLELTAQAVSGGLSYMDSQRLEAFLADYKSRGKRHGPLVMSLPLNSPNSAIFDRAAAETYAWADAYGVPSIARSDYESGGAPEAPLVLAFTHYQAIPPKCPPISSYDYTGSATNDPRPSFGCAAQHNLAMMVADPADLLGARRSDPADTARRALVLTNYRAGRVTASERADGESGVISDAVE